MDPRKLERFNSPAGAEDYAAKWRRRPSKRLNNWSEQRALRRLLKGQIEVPLSLALDLPCGFGRLYPVLQEIAERVLEADYSQSMLVAARARQRTRPAAGYLRANALWLPFAESSFDLVFSARLSHHIRLEEERRRYLRELLRVSRRYVLFSHWDPKAWKTRWRAYRSRQGGKRPKSALSQEEIERLAAEARFKRLASIPFSRPFSGQRYTLLVRQEGS